MEPFCKTHNIPPWELYYHLRHDCVLCHDYEKFSGPYGSIEDCAKASEMFASGIFAPFPGVFTYSRIWSDFLKQGMFFHHYLDAAERPGKLIESCGRYVLYDGDPCLVGRGGVYSVTDLGEWRYIRVFIPSPDGLDGWEFYPHAGGTSLQVRPSVHLGIFQSPVWGGDCQHDDSLVFARYAQIGELRAGSIYYCPICNREVFRDGTPVLDAALHLDDPVRQARAMEYIVAHDAKE